MRPREPVGAVIIGAGSLVYALKLWVAPDDYSWTVTLSCAFLGAFLAFAIRRTFFQ